MHDLDVRLRLTLEVSGIPRNIPRLTSICINRPALDINYASNQTT